jgi:hypothetical protein
LEATFSSASDDQRRPVSPPGQVGSKYKQKRLPDGVCLHSPPVTDVHWADDVHSRGGRFELHAAITSIAEPKRDDIQYLPETPVQPADRDSFKFLIGTISRATVGGLTMYTPQCLG